MARILVVDDEVALLKAIDSLLTRMGHIVTTATNAAEAMEKLKASLTTTQFHLLITDASMPGGMSGFDLTSAVRADKKLHDLPVIILTGGSERKDVERGIASGADDYMVKPVDPETFRKKISALVTESTVASPTAVETVLSEAAMWDVPFTVARVSDFGMTFYSLLPAVVGQKFKVKTKIFEQIGIEPPVLNVDSCNRDRQGDQPFVIKAQFFELPEKSANLVKHWIRDRLAATRAS